MDNSNNHPQMDDRSETLRTRVTNGRDVLPAVDGRTLWVRRLKDVMLALIADLGGEDAISEAERNIVRRTATQTVAIEKLEARFAQDGEASDRGLDMHQRLSNTLRRNLESLGLKRRSRDITPDLSEYIAPTHRGG